MNTVSIRILLFAAAREIAGRDSVELHLPPESTVDDLRTALLQQYPQLERLATSLLWAVNNEYAALDRVVRASDAIACFPPVSGG